MYREIMAAEPLDPTTPRSAALIDFVFAEVWSRGGISRRDRRLVTISCVAAAGDLAALAEHVYAALKTGDLTVAELDELAMHLSVYCGCTNAQTVEGVLSEQIQRLSAEGEHGMLRQPMHDDDELPKPHANGEQEYSSANCSSDAPRGAPYYDAIVDFVYGRVWSRQGVSRRDRRLMSLVCAGYASATEPIRSHVRSALQSGDVTLSEMSEIVLHFAAYAGWPKAQFVQQVADEFEQLADLQSVRS